MLSPVLGTEDRLTLEADSPPLVLNKLSKDLDFLITKKKEKELKVLSITITSL